MAESSGISTHTHTYTQEVAKALIAENKAHIDNCLNDLSREKQEWKERLHQSTTTCDRLTQVGNINTLLSSNNTFSDLCM